MTEAAHAIPSPVDPDDDVHALGRRVRQLRTHADLTLDEVARAADVSVSLLSRVERGSAQPSLGTIRAIARALRVRIADLFDAEGEVSTGETDSQGRQVVVRHAGRRHLQVPDSSIRYELMVPDLEGDLEVIWGVVPPGRGQVQPSSHPGEEVVVCLDGELVLDLDDREFVLGPGDAARFDRTRPHRLHNRRAVSATFLLAVTPPSS